MIKIATIKTTILLQDRATQHLRRIRSSVDTVTNGMRELDRVSERSLSSAQAKSYNNELRNITSSGRQVSSVIQESENAQKRMTVEVRRTTQQAQNVVDKSRQIAPALNPANEKANKLLAIVKDVASARTATLILQDKISQPARMAKTALDESLQSLRAFEKDLQKSLSPNQVKQLESSFKSLESAESNMSTAILEAEKMQNRLTSATRQTANEAQNVAEKSQQIAPALAPANNTAENLFKKLVKTAAARTATIVLRDKVSQPMKAAKSAIDSSMQSLKSMERDLKRSLSPTQAKQLKSEFNNLERASKSISSAISESEKLQKNFTEEAKKSKNELQNTAEKAQQIAPNFGSANVGAQRLLGTVTQIASTVAGIVGIKKIVDISDEVTNTNSRLDLMNDGYRTRDELKQSIYQSSQNSRSNYMDNQQSIAKLGVLAPDAFKNNNELVRFNELMNKQFKIGGASTQESSSAMYQLTQAMASGRLQGDEYVSIVENAPMLAKAITDVFEPLGYTLKEAAKEGYITADVIKYALFNVADETEARFRTMPMTVSDYMTQIGNFAMEKFDPVFQKISEFVNSPTFQNGVNQLMQGIGTAANWIIQNFDNIKKIALNVINNIKTIGSNVASTLSSPLKALGGIAQFAVKNWNKILPVVAFATGAVKGLQMGIGLLTAVQKINTLLTVSSTAAEAGHAAAKTTSTIATGAATIAQGAYNIALWACPVMAIVGGVGLLIGAMATLANTTDISTESTKTWAEEQRIALAEREKQIEDNIATDMTAAEKARILAEEFNQLAKQSTRTKEDIERLEGITQQLNEIIPNATFEFKNERDALEELRKKVLETADAFYKFALAKATANMLEDKIDEKLSAKYDAQKKLEEQQAQKQGLSKSLYAAQSNFNAMSNKIGDKPLIANDDQVAPEDVYYSMEETDRRRNKITDAQTNFDSINKDITATEKYITDLDKGIKDDIMKQQKEMEEVYGSIFEPKDNSAEPPPDLSNLGSIKEDTEAIKNTLELTHEDLKYLRDIAERETINRFTTAEVNVNFGDINHNVSSKMDIDGVVAIVTSDLQQALASSAEGIHI